MPSVNGRFYLNPAYGRAVEHARLVDQAREGGEDLKGHWVTINHHHVFIDDIHSDQNDPRNAQKAGSQLKFRARVLIGGAPYSHRTKDDGKNKNDVVQPPAFLDIGLIPTQRLAPGLYRVDVSLTRDTQEKDNGKVIDAEIEAGINDVQGASGVLKGVQELPVGTNKIPLSVAISAKHGDPGYEGPANVDVVITGSNGTQGRFSLPVHVEKGNTGAPTVVGRSGGRTSFMVPQ